jgi:hypothetical protein
MKQKTIKVSALELKTNWYCYLKNYHLMSGVFKLNAITLFVERVKRGVKC